MNVCLIMQDVVKRGYATPSPRPALTFLEDALHSQYILISVQPV